MSDLAPRPRSATEIVDAAFQLYRRNPVQLMLVTALVNVPLLVVNVVVMNSVGYGTPGFRFTTATLKPMLVLYVMAFLVYAVVEAALARMASELYMDRECDAWDALRVVGGRIGPVVVASVVRNIFVGLMAVFFVIPGCYFFARFFAVVPAIVIEGATVPRAFSRSSALSVGLKMHILGTLILALLILFALSAGFAAFSVVVHALVVQQVVSTLIGIVIYPLVSLTQVALYYDSRIRLEGYDIELMAAMSGGPMAPSEVLA